jgi:hypothetical protein
MEKAALEHPFVSVDGGGRYSTEHRPLLGYAALTGLFNLAFGGAIVVASRRERLPSRFGIDDLFLIGVATHKLSRLLSKDRVTSFLRAPFTRYKGSSGHGEVEEEPRGQGLRLAIGELVVCPYCMGQWVAAGFVTGLVFAPRPTRAVAGVFTALTVSDFLQMAFKEAEERAS